MQKANKVEMTTINFRLEKSLKEEAEKLFAAMGISTSTALKMFLAQSVLEGKMPFCPGGTKNRHKGCAVTSDQAITSNEQAGSEAILGGNDTVSTEVKMAPTGNETVLTERKTTSTESKGALAESKGESRGTISEQESAELNKIINDERNDETITGGENAKTKKTKLTPNKKKPMAMSAEAILNELRNLVGDDVRVRTIEIEEIIDE